MNDRPLHLAEVDEKALVYIVSVNQPQTPGGLRLLELGLTPGTPVLVWRHRRFDRLMQVKVRGVMLSMGVGDARGIVVTLQAPIVNTSLPSSGVPLFAPRWLQPKQGLAIKVALLGNPNSGKSTLFAALTHQKVPTGNYPGVTVEQHQATMLKVAGQASDALSYEIFDLPGCYSLQPQSLEEAITTKFLQDDHGADVVVCVMDSTTLARSLYLLLQLRGLQKPVIAVFNMVDALPAAGITIDWQTLAQRLGVACVRLSARSGFNVSHLQHTLIHLPRQPMMPNSYAKAVSLPIEGPEQIVNRYRLVDDCLHNIVHQKNDNLRYRVETWVDDVLLHSVMGKVVLATLMFGLLQLVFWASAPFAWGIEWLLGVVGDSIQQHLPFNQLTSLINQGLLVGIGNVLTFLPQIMLLFMGIAALEESGLMARVVYMLDGLMRRFGLGGRSIVPLLSSCGCAIPGIMATRLIASRAERLATIFVAPLMSCSARLPVYWVVTAALFAGKPWLFGVLPLSGIVVFSMYLLGFVAALLTAKLLRRFFLRDVSVPLLFEFPIYRRPTWLSMIKRGWERAKNFAADTGVTMVVLSVLLWGALSYPQHPNASSAQTKIEYSYAGQLGHWLEPVLKPLGFDWRIGVSLVASFAAREVLVTTLGQVYGLEQESMHVPSLRRALQNDIDPITQKPRFTVLVGMSLLVFFVLALQCSSTLVVVWRETGSVGWPLVQLVVMNGMAYMASLLVYQGGLWLGWG